MYNNGRESLVQTPIINSLEMVHNPKHPYPINANKQLTKFKRHLNCNTSNKSEFPENPNKEGNSYYFDSDVDDQKELLSENNLNKIYFSNHLILPDKFEHKKEDKSLFQNTQKLINIENNCVILRRNLVICS